MTKIIRTKSNTEFISDLMNFSEQGALIQPFVIEGIYQYAKQVLANPLSDNGFISPAAWTACAQEVLDKLEQRLEMK
jgi:hypothetical protein